MTPILGNIAVDLFLKGGPIMWPILLCFLASLVVVIGTQPLVVEAFTRNTLGYPIRIVCGRLRRRFRHCAEACGRW